MKPSMKILDPMCGSGTSLVAARLTGHEALGFDTDPLALMIGRAWSQSIRAEKVWKIALRLLVRANARFLSTKPEHAYPSNIDQETRTFIEYWFDEPSRRQLAALATEIQTVGETSIRVVLWCAFSRLIITKNGGASLAMDVSHSRPHRVYDEAPIKPLQHFLKSVEAVIRRCPFQNDKTYPLANVRSGDARRLRLQDESIDLVITSPPYLNAIDYLRGHKLSLVWMGHGLEKLRSLRSGNIGAEAGLKSDDTEILTALRRMGKTSDLPERYKRMLIRYLTDMRLVISELHRVLRPGGEAVLVLGDCNLRGIFVSNSRALSHLARRAGFTVVSRRRRPLAQNRRYLPPPEKEISGQQLRTRMREEVLLVFRKIG